MAFYRVGLMIAIFNRVKMTELNENNRYDKALFVIY